MTIEQLIIVGGVLLQIGIWYQTSRSNTKAIENLAQDVKDHKDAIWPVVTQQGNDISKIKGHLGINGEFHRGNGHHV